MNLSRPSMAIAAAFLMIFTNAASAFDHATIGLSVRSSPSTIDFTLKPVIIKWDTTRTEGGEQVAPEILGGRPRQSADGSLVQYVVPFDVIVPGPTGFSMEVTDLSTTHHALALQPGFTPEGILIPTPEPLSTVADMRYTGIGRGRHYATVTVVVAETRNGVTTILPEIKGTIHLAPSAAVATVPLDRSVEDASTLAVVNPDAPWVVSRVSQTYKSAGETVQGLEVQHGYILEISEEGIHRITADQLRGAGIPTDANAAATLKIYGLGGGELPETISPAANDQLHEQDIIVRTNNDGSIADVVFYAGGPTGWKKTGEGIRHYIDHYDTRAGYLLTYGGEAGRRATTRPAAPEPADHSPLTTLGYVFNEEELTSPYNQGSGRKWWGRSIINDGSLIVSTSLPGLVRNGQVTYRMNVAHNGTSSGTVTAFENGTGVSQRVLGSVPQYMDTYSGRMSGSFDAAQIAADGKSVLRFTYASSDKAANGFLDWFEISYPRGLIANDREFWFFTDSTIYGTCEYTVNGFEGGDVFAFDVTDPANPQRVTNVAPSGGLCSIRETLDSGEVRKYFISSKLRTPGIRSVGSLQLRAKAAAGELGDLLIITHPSLMESATNFAEYRRANSDLTVSVVTTEQIYNEFSYGVKDPTAYRDYIGHVYRHSPLTPRYVLLWGDGHFDYKNISTQVTNFILPYESLDPDDREWGLSTYTTDDYFVRLEGNDTRPELSIGRLPLISNQAGDKMTAKISAYEHQASRDDWRTRIALIADDGQTSNNETDGALHLNQSEELSADYVPAPFQPKKFYLVEYPTENVARGRRKPAVTADYISTMNTSGYLLMNWIGHGNPRVWAHEFVFERETTPAQMNNPEKPFFLTAATCDFARYDLADVQSGAEEMLLLDHGGAIGIFSAARVVFSYANDAINKEFYTQTFARDANGRMSRLGDVMYRVRQRFNGDNDEKFHLLADPTMKLLIPESHVVFETINGAEIGSETIQIKALSTVTITGHIKPPDNEQIDATFNGTATVSLLDAERYVTAVDTDKNQSINKFILPGAALSRGSYKVENGRFTATFVVPKDISFSNENARLYGYAISDDDRTAMGVTDQLIVNEVASESFDDDEGPDIQIFMDSRLFLAGDIVRKHPILIVDLQDLTGINTTGIGVGHGIQASFDEGALVEDITETFTTSLENSRAGTATKQIFTLEDGYHTVRVRAWDVLNNMAEAVTSFRIAPEDEGIVTSWVFNYPNPFAASTTIRFKHNTNNPFTAQISIYDVQGRQVFDAPMDVQDMQTAEIHWNGRGNDGSVMPTGVYVALINVTDASGESSVVSGKLSLIR